MKTYIKIKILIAINSRARHTIKNIQKNQKHSKLFEIVKNIIYFRFFN